MRKIAALLALLVLTTTVLAGCGGESGAGVPTAIQGSGAAVDTPAPEQPTSTPGTLPACAGPTTPIALPITLPENFPFPPGTVMTTRDDTATTIVISGVSPMDAKSVADFYATQLPLSGYKQTNPTSAAGSTGGTWTGQGFKGTWKAEDISGCAGASKLSIQQGGQ